MRQRKSEYLIGPAGGIVAMLAVDDVEEMTLLGAPESFVE